MLLLLLLLCFLMNPQYIQAEQQQQQGARIFITLPEALCQHNQTTTSTYGGNKRETQTRNEDTAITRKQHQHTDATIPTLYIDHLTLSSSPVHLPFLPLPLSSLLQDSDDECWLWSLVDSTLQLELLQCITAAGLYMEKTRITIHDTTTHTPQTRNMKLVVDIAPGNNTNT